MQQMAWLSLRLCRLTNCICVLYLFLIQRGNLYFDSSMWKLWLFESCPGRFSAVLRPWSLDQPPPPKKNNKKKRVKPGKPSFLLLQMFLFAVPLGNSEHIVEDGVRRSHAGKLKAKNDLSCQRGIWRLLEARRWEPSRRARTRAECRCAKRAPTISVDARSQKGQFWDRFFATSTVSFCHHLLGCSSSMHRDRRGKIGNRRVSNPEIHFIPKIVSSD